MKLNSDRHTLIFRFKVSSKEIVDVKLYTDCVVLLDRIPAGLFNMLNKQEIAVLVAVVPNALL